MDNPDLLRRCGEFAARTSLTLGEQLGAGVQGIVFAAKSQADEGRFALKVHKQQADYLRERDAYLRLKSLGITTIHGCNVPELIAYDDGLFCIVMTVVARPFVLDFGGAFLDRPPDFSDEIMLEWQEEKEEQFGARWPEVCAIIGELESHGIFLIDTNPGNISFGD
jgi:hypothetical protein